MLRWLWPSVPKRVCIWTSFLTGFPHYAQTEAWSANSESDWSRVYAYFGVTCHLHFCQNNWGLLCATAVPLGWNGHRIRVSKQSWLWWRNFSSRSSQEIEPATFRSQVRRSNQQAIPASWSKTQWITSSFWACHALHLNCRSTQAYQ